jgi:peptide deformylase
MGEIREIAKLGHPVLRETANAVIEINDVVQQLIDDLFATSEAANGAGIAAPQIHVSSRVFILSIKPTPRYPNAPSMEPTAVINPEVLWKSDESKKDWEGCLSVPGIRGRVPRPIAIQVRYTTREGVTVESEFSDFAARVFLHEFDHLEGLTWLDHVENNRDIFSEDEYLKIVTGQGQTAGSQ